MEGSVRRQTCILSSGGWRGIGEFATIRRSLRIGGRLVQVVSYTKQLDRNGSRRSRDYFELRTTDAVVNCDTAVKTVKAAVAAAHAMYGPKEDGQ